MLPLCLYFNTNQTLYKKIKKTRVKQKAGTPTQDSRPTHLVARALRQLLSASLLALQEDWHPGMEMRAPWSLFIQTLKKKSNLMP
jgi:hypothetical protein